MSLPPTLQATLQAGYAAFGQGRLADAERAARQVLSAAPAQATALNLLGLVGLRSNHVERAAKLFAGAVEAEPTNPDFRANLSAALMTLGRADEARPHLQTALKLKPSDPAANLNFALLLMRDGDFKAARGHLAKTLKKQPDNADALMNQGLVEGELGHGAVALKHLEKAARLAPGNPVVQNNLGNALLRSGDAEGALTAYDAALKLQPGHIKAHSNRAGALGLLGRAEESEASLLTALKLDPDYVPALTNLGDLLVTSGPISRLDDALSIYRRVVELTPDDANAHFNQGRVLKFLGHEDDARRALERAVELDGGFTRAIFTLAELIRFTPDHPLLAHLQALSEAAFDDPGDAARVHYALARARHQLGDYDAAFDHYAQGAAIKRRSQPFDVARDEALFDDIKRTFTAERMSPLPRAWKGSERPIFIVGMPRSGTSLMEQMLAAHSDIAGAGELAVLTRLAPISGIPGLFGLFPDFIDGLDAAGFRALGEAYLKDLEGFEGAHVTDKMPENYLYAGLIAKALPGAKIVHMIRDPLDTCLSCFTQLFGDALDYTYDLAELGGRYRRYRDLMEHWRSVMPGRILDVSYEALTDDPENELKRVLEHIGLAWQDACLDFHTLERAVTTASTLQVRRPIYHAAKGRWRAYEKHLGALQKALGG